MPCVNLHLELVELPVTTINIIQVLRRIPTLMIGHIATDSISAWVSPSSARMLWYTCLVYETVLWAYYPSIGSFTCCIPCHTHGTSVYSLMRRTVIQQHSQRSRSAPPRSGERMETENSSRLWINFFEHSKRNRALTLSANFWRFLADDISA